MTDADADLERRRAQVAQLVEEALASLERRGWPGATLVRTRGGFIRASRGGWLLAEWDTTVEGRPATIECYLLQNGKLSVGVARPDRAGAVEHRHDAGEIAIRTPAADAVLSRAPDLVLGLQRLID